MSLGNQTVIFVTITDGALDRLGIPVKVRTEVPVSGCRFRPMGFDEAVALTDLATRPWKCTAPPHPAVMAMAAAIDGGATGELKVGGVTYQIVGGVKPFPGYAGGTHKVTVICQIQSG